MSYSFTSTGSRTFTLTHARHLAAKVATDLKRMQRFYLYPQDDHIANLEGELTELLRLGYLSHVIYGFKRDGNWIEPTLRYTAKELSDQGLDDDPGRVLPGKDVKGASFYSYLVYSAAWHSLNPDQRNAIKQGLPIQRSGAEEPFTGSLYFADDRTYSSGSRSLGRSSLRSL